MARERGCHGGTSNDLLCPCHRLLQPQKTSSPIMKVTFSLPQDHAALRGRSDGKRTPAPLPRIEALSPRRHAKHASTLYFNRTSSSRCIIFAAAIFHRLHVAYRCNTTYMSRILETIYRPHILAAFTSWSPLRLYPLNAGGSACTLRIRTALPKWSSQGS